MKRTMALCQRLTNLVPGLLLALIASPSLADDRALFQAANAKPYVFFLVDISSSMHFTPSGARPPASGEDPASRLYQAKRATYEVVEEVGDSVHYGWATFNRERMRVRRKHWLYKLEEDPPFYPSIPILPAGKPVIFGEPRHRHTGEVGDNTAGGDATSIDDTNKFYTHRWCHDPTPSEDKILDFPKLGHLGDYITRIYYTDSGNDFRITFAPLVSSQRMGDMTLQVQMLIERRQGDCVNEFTQPNTFRLLWRGQLNFVRFYTDDQDAEAPLPFEDFTDYISWGRSGNDTPGFNMEDYQVTNGCDANILNRPEDPDHGRSHRWDGNFDFDTENGDVVSYDVIDDPMGRGRELARGDLIPWDWESDVYSTSNREEILLRLAPNLAIGETVPDFRVARYFENEPVGSGGSRLLPLRPEFADRPPIMGARGTPISGALTSLRGWYDEWEKRAEDPATGDTTFACREKFIILLTDGAESCESGSISDPSSPRRTMPCDAARELYDRGINTFVVAFGVTPSELATLECIADEGGTGAGQDVDDDGEIDNPGRDKNNDGVPDGPGPITANNKDELVEALLELFDLVQPRTSAISAAAVPSVQADVADKIYLTEFTPLDTGSVWAGSLQSFVKPLPLNADGLPDKTRRCSESETSGCLAWDAQEVVVEEQVKGSETDPLGFESHQRRVFYSKLEADDGAASLGISEQVPRQRRFLEPVDSADSSHPPAAFDLWRGLGIDFEIGDSASEANAALMAEQTLEATLELKAETLPDGRELEFVVGDFFHSDPVVVGSPSNTAYFIQDLGGDLAVNCEAGDPKSYRCFALRHQFRRKMLFLGSNAGMLHAFDTGIYQLPPEQELVDLGSFDNGTGREIFAYTPRAVLPTLVDMAIEDPNRHKFTVDGPPTAADVMIDPIHEGVDSVGNPPKDEDREWRTVLMGGLRRGGSKTGDRAFSFGDVLDPEVVKPDVADPLADTDIQWTSGYYLLDITQPDLIQSELIPNGRNDRDGDGAVDIWVPTGVISGEAPDCMGDTSDGSAGNLPANCGSLPFGTPLWEFLDLMIGGETALGDTMPPLRLDEDDNGFVDLGFTWSKPVIGRLRVCTGTQCDPNDDAQVASGDQEDRFVAIFGGGIDPLHADERGNWIYIVDIETGTAIYKQPVIGAVPGRPAVRPTLDGYIDRIYFGTTAGYLYRLDMRPEDLDGNVILPQLRDVLLVEEAIDPADPLGSAETISKTVQRIEPLSLPAESSETFRPRLLLDINTPSEDPRPIFMAPTTFFVAELGQTAIAVGAGNREDLFTTDQPPGRMVVFVDDILDLDLRASGFKPRTLDLLQEIESTFDGSGQDFLADRSPGERGWYLDFGEDERMVGEPLVIAGLLFFSTFTPIPPAHLGVGDTVICEDSGLSRIYGTLVTNAEGVLADAVGVQARQVTVSGLVTAPFAEQSQTKNPEATGSTGSSVPPELDELMEELKGQFPANCTFPPGHRLDIKVRNQDTGLTFIVPIPICIIESSFLVY